jgi:hypothetical protein
LTEFTISLLIGSVGKMTILTMISSTHREEGKVLLASPLAVGLTAVTPAENLLPRRLISKVGVT